MALRRALIACCALLAAPLLVSPPASADPVPAGAAWHEEYITEPDGTVLHADVLRPAGLPADAKTPVILSVGPYFNHTGQTGLAGLIEGTDWNILGTGPSSRFSDFVTGAKLMERGYTFVMVDLRGFGGSTGCQDWVGPGEQADVKAAVGWAASRPWSTGKVGMYGKSYDAVTGLVGVANRPAGLAAVVAQEPVYDMYRYLYMNGVRYENSALTPLLYDLIATNPGSLLDSATYQAAALNDFQRPGCQLLNWADQQSNDHASAYWKARDLISKAKGSTVPLFLTQGLLEDNTKPDGFADFWGAVAGPKRAWFGMWDHVRGNETDENGRLKMGRAGWFDEVMRFYDLHLKGIQPSIVDPPVAVESSDGHWRAEDAWPPADAGTVTATLRTGSYLDQPLTFSGTGSEDTGQTLWTFSPQLPYDAHLAGTPRATLDLSALLPGANVVVDVYDVDAVNKATLISRGTHLLGSSGTVSFDLFGQDWRFPAGHRIGVAITPENFSFWAHTPTLQQVTVRSASVSLPWLRCARTGTIQGDRSVKLDSYLTEVPFTSTKVADNVSPAFPLPAQQTC